MTLAVVGTRREMSTPVEIHVEAELLKATETDREVTSPDPAEPAGGLDQSTVGR